MKNKPKHIIILGAGTVGSALANLLRPHIAQITLIDPDPAKNPTAPALDQTIAPASLYFIAVPTPSAPDGSADTTQVQTAAAQIAQHINHCGTTNAIIVNRSTCPPGTAEHLQTIITAHTSHTPALLAMPEFLRQNFADQDTLHPHRIIIGTGFNDFQAASQFADLWRAIHKKTRPRIFLMSRRSAETFKHVANAMLAVRIAAVNELTDWAKTQGADPNDIYTKALGLDPRIGPIHASTGYQGACLPKDVTALLKTTSAKAVPILSSAHASNTERLRRAASK